MRTTSTFWRRETSTIQAGTISIKRATTNMVATMRKDSMCQAQSRRKSITVGIRRFTERRNTSMRMSMTLRTTSLRRMTSRFKTFKKI